MKMKMKIGHYQQATPDTCDPACLMMAMHALDGRIRMTRELEMSIWKESNLGTVKGCLPQGLALSAIGRGFHAEIICKKENMDETTRNDMSVAIAKRQTNRCSKRDIKVISKAPSLSDVKISLRQNKVPMVLVNSYKVHGVKSPHWIVISKITSKKVFFHDPLLGGEISLNRRDFSAMHSGIKQFLNKRMLIISR